MKIVDICESYSEHGGGVRTYVQQKLQASARAGHEVVIVAPGEKDQEERRAGGRIVWIKSVMSPFDRRYGLFVRERDVHAVLDEEKPDVVEGSSPWGGGWFASSWAGEAKKAFIFHTDVVAVWPQTFFGHRLGFDRIDRWFAPYWRSLRRLTSRYDATVVSGDWLAQRLERFGVHRPVVVGFGIDKRRFSPDQRDLEHRARLIEACGAPADAKLLVIVSRLDPEKRVGMLLDAFRMAARRRPLALAVFGRGSIERLVRRKAAGISGVHVGGYLSGRDEMARTFASADALLHGSAAETYGLVVAEAICSGLPVVVPHLGGAAALAEPGCSEIYRTGDPRACADAIGRLLDRDPLEVGRDCARAADRISTMDDHFRSLFDLYSQLTGLPAALPHVERTWESAL